MQKTKYLIIGAGLAGSACAYLLKRAGKDVLLVERSNTKTKSKLCAGLVTPRAYRTLQKIYGELPAGLFKEHMQSMLCVADTMPVMVHGIEMRSVLRHELDSFALNKYLELGGKLLDSFHVRDFDFSNRRIVGSHDGGEPEVHDYDVLIAADGALSPTRKKLTGSAPDSILALEAEVDACGRGLVMAYTDGFHGYSWYAPTGKTAKIGCCAYSGSPDLDTQLAAFAREMEVKYSKRRGAFIPTGSDVLLQKEGVYFLGDAASLICPPSGEGIYYALYSAYRLSLALINHANYAALMAHEVAQIKRQYFTRDLFFNTRFMTCGLKLADSTSYGSERAVKFALRHFTSFE